MTISTVSKLSNGNTSRRLHRVFALVSLLFASWLPIGAAAQVTATWQQVQASTPPSWRGWSVMTWVDSLNKIVLWGGSGGAYLNDVSSFDPLSLSWTNIEPNDSCVGNTSLVIPNGTDESGVVFDPINNYLWISNGGSGYRCGTPQQVGRTAGAGTTSTSIVDPT